MLAGGLIISRRFVQVRTTPKHRSTQISNYQSSEHELSQHDEILVYPQEHFAYHKRLFGMSFASKELGYLAALLLLLLLLAHYKLSVYQTTLLLTILALADITLPKTTCHFLMLLVGFNTLTYRTELYTCGSSGRRGCGRAAGGG